MSKRERFNYNENSSSSEDAIVASSRTNRSTSEERSTVTVNRFREMVTTVISTSSLSTDFALESIPTFDPEDPVQTAVNWCKKVDELRDIHKWDDKTTVLLLVPKLQGMAQKWFIGLPSVPSTWEEWKAEIVKAFPFELDYHLLLTEMINRNKRRNESYGKYYFEKLELLNACNISGRNAVSCIIGGIDDPILQACAKAGFHATPNSLFVFLNSVGDALHRREQKLHSKEKLKAHKVSETNTKTLQKITKRDSKKEERACFKCGKHGHIKMKCTVGLKSEVQKVRFCSFCRSHGHTDDFCFKKKKQILVDAQEIYKTQVTPDSAHNLVFKEQASRWEPFDQKKLCFDSAVESTKILGRVYDPFNNSNNESPTYANRKENYTSSISNQTNCP